MVQYRDLNAPPSRMLADVVADMKASERQSKTGDAGVKDLGEDGDVQWETPSGPTSVRVESENMRQLGIDLGELNEVVLPELADDLDAAKTDLQAKLDAANARIDDIVVDGGGAGNFTTYSINEPTGDGAGEGDQWFRVVNGEVIGQWRWDGAAWVPVTLTDAVIAGIDLSKLVSNGNLSEVVANKIWADLFTANKITAQEIESGSITSQHIASEGIIADVIQGGHFTGETFEGGTFIGGEIRTSDELPGQVSLRDDGYVDGDGFSRPGIRINPTSTYNPARPPGIGSNANGLIVSGGSNASGDRAFVTAEPTLVGLRSRNAQTGRDAQVYADASQAVLYSQSDAGGLSRIYANNYNVEMTSQGATGSRGRARASQYTADLVVFNADGTTNAEVYAYTYKAGVNGRFGGVRRSIYIDADGVWAETTRSGTTERWNLEETASDSGWRTFPMNSALAGAGSPAYRIKSGTVFLRGSVTLPGASWSAGWTTIGVLPAAATPTFDVQRPTITSAMSQVPETYLQTNTSGQFQVWIPRSVAGTTVIQLSPMSYVAG